MTIPLKNEASLVACRRVLAKLYNSHSNMAFALRMEILEALGYGDEQKMIGYLLAGQACLKEDGTIEVYTAIADRD